MSIKYKVSDEELEDYIHKYSRDLTALAREDRFDPIHGRDEEILQVILILLQKGRKNAALLAPAGVGKTALCIGLAQQIVLGNVPKYMENARVLDVDLASMAAGTESNAEFQARFIPFVKGVAERHHDDRYPPFVLFIDEMHTIMPSATGSAYRGLSEVMKPYLTVGDLHVIGATTLDEFRMYVAEDPAMDRRFQKIHLSMPDTKATIEILKALRPNFEKHFQTKISDECINIIVKLADEHMRKRTQPDKSIITMDAACAKFVLDNGYGGELDKESIYYMVGRETGIHAGAFEED